MQPRGLPLAWRVAACLVALAVAAAVAVALTAGPGRTPAQDAAAKACRSYADTARTSTVATAQQGDAVRATARAQADRAAAADPRYEQLRADVQEASTVDTRTGTAALDAYFTADRRVQADCAAAGQDIGPLRP